MPFQSLLFISPPDLEMIKNNGMPEFFPDLNLDKLVDAMGTRAKGQDLSPFFTGL